MKKNFFKEEFKRRNEFDKNTYNMIGTEIKRLRLSKSRTLSAIADNVCSVSYLCKIEKAQMKPNHHTLGEICKRLEIDDEQLNVLFKLKEMLFLVVDYFYENNIKEIKRINEESKQFNNYRSKLIELIYMLSLKDIKKASSICEELFKIASAMYTNELNVFLVFYSLLSFYNEEYKETIDNLQSIASLNNDNIVSVIAYEILFKCYYKMNSPYTLLIGSNLDFFYLNQSNFKKSDFVRYLMSLYKVSNNMLDLAIKDLKTIRNESYRSTLKFFLDLSIKNIKDKKNYKDLRPFAKLIYTYVYEKDKYLEAYLNENNYLDCDYSKNIASYLSYSTNTEKYNQLLDVIFPNLFVTNNTFERDFFLNELCKLSVDCGKYKAFCKIFEGFKHGDTALSFEVIK